MTGRRVSAVLVVAVAWGLCVAAVVVPLQRGQLTGLFGPDLGAALSFSVVGAFLLVRGAVRDIAVLLSGASVGAAVTTVTGVWREDAAAAGPLHGAGLWAAWVNDVSWLFGVASLVPLILLFPDGRLWSARWRWPIVVTVIAASVLFVVGAFGRIGLVDGRAYDFAPNPVGFLPVPRAALDLVSEVTFVVLVLAIAVSLGAIIARRRAAGGVQRAQLTSLFYGGALAVLLGVAGQFSSHGPFAFVLGVVTIVPVAVAIAVAVLRYRLYEIDRIVSRTLAYGLTVAVLAGVYAAIVIGLGALLPASVGSVGVAIATLIVVAVFLPLTRRIRRLLDRRFNRGGADRARVVARFAEQTRRDVTPETTATSLLGAVGMTLQPAHAGLWLVPERVAS